MSHISASIQEVMESHELPLSNKVHPIKSVRNITGHNILHYKIHGDKQVPFFSTPSSTQRMQEGDIFAIETFGTTGSAWLKSGEGVYGYGRVEGANLGKVRSEKARKLAKTIDERFGSLVFSKRYLEHAGVKGWHLGMRELVEKGVMDVYEPLVDVKGSWVAQFEHVSHFRSFVSFLFLGGEGVG